MKILVVSIFLLLVLNSMDSYAQNKKVYSSSLEEFYDKKEHYWDNYKYKIIEIGMDEHEVIAILGHPKEVNTSVGAWGTHKQYVYPDRYVYIENGKVTSWQE